ncbi:hypothetical protein DRA42_06350 [Ethanoligenens harbinense]|nr:hypothetical protein CXQ68_06325 [Ethanoligenens harbinense YUAN-3]AYF38544.1 hypothetical protein CXP51_06190 [Ethanoligenens harbinense]AYF41290.1 hypothetical protein CN246_06330 [Ethanoligenens harbinense]QCN92123.1 hypothetical protein DRA42_06350 [Ethanoligenens harbinense]
MLTLINSLSSKPFEIDVQGYLKLKADAPEDQTKSALFADKLLSLINGQERIILSPATEIWYDNSGEPAPSPTGFGDAYSIQIQGEKSRLVLLDGSLFKAYGTDASNVTVSSLLLDQLLEDGIHYSNLISKELAEKSSRLLISAFSINIAAAGTMTSAQTSYAGPGGSIYAQVGSVDNGEYISIIDFEQGWLYIEYGTANGNKRGYVPSGSVSYSGSVPTADYHGGYYNAPNANLNVYYLPTVSGLSVGSIYAYEGATVLETSGNIAYIEYSSPSGTKRGYVWTSQLCSRHDGVIGIVTASSTPVYAGTDTHFASVGSIDRTEYTVILKSSGLWAFVEYNTPSGRKRGYTWVENIGDHYSLSNLPSIEITRNLGVSTANLPAYTGPNPNYAQMGSVFAGDQVNIITENEYGWCYVEYYTGGSASKRGYVDINAIQHISLDSLPTPSGVSAIPYGTSSSQRLLNAYKLGTGPNVLFGVFEQHGFEDGWAADGVELVKIANSLIANLNGNGNLSKWTVYVIPSANPDGLLSGYTNNGFGRCTAAWVDMNRSHNTNPLAYYTDDRNRTNNNAPEVVSLENFVSQHKSGAGQNVLLDVHGWENSTLGDPTVSSYFDNALGLNHVSNGGSDGYLIKWGMQNGINSTLVELPLPANPQDVINRNLSGEFISAVNNLLANTGVPASSTSAPEGWLDVVDGDRIAGWARDRDNLADSIWVHIYIRNRNTQEIARFAAVLANCYRGDVAPGSHGFNYAVDWRTIPPGEYQIETYAIGQNGNNPPLSGTPKYYTVNASNGCVDYVDSSGVGGWVWKSSAPNLPIEAHVYVYDSNGTQVYGVPVTANQYRSDLANLRYGNGHHGFSTSIPWSSLPLGPLKIVVYAVDGSGTNSTIYNSTVKNPSSPDYSYTKMASYLSHLTDAVNHYKSSTGATTSSIELALQYIRRGEYDSSRWTQAAGAINHNMINYINGSSNYQDLQYYFTNGTEDYIEFVDPITNAKIDAIHMFSTLNVLVHDTSPNEAGWLPATAGESLIDDLGGWAGDLETFQNDIVKANHPNDYQINYNLAISLLRENSGSTFPISDFNADADALNMYWNLIGSSSTLPQLFSNYYQNQTKKRYTSFAGHIVSEHGSLLEGAMDYISPLSAIEKISPLMKNCNPTIIQATAVASAFRDRCEELMSNE